MPVAASTTSPRAAGTTEPDDTDVATPAPAPAPTTVATSAAVDAVIDVDNQPGSDDYEGARDDVTDVTCTAYSGRWAAAGIVTNPTDTNVSYRIYVSYLDRAGETLGLIERDVDDVAPLEHSEWSTELESSAVDLSCVLRVERLAAG